MKRYMNWALVYGILAMAGGVFYREFTKASGFIGKTMLSVIHTHYFILGMVFFLLLLLLEKSFSFSGSKTARRIVIYHIALNVTIAMMIVRGIIEAMGVSLSTKLDACISGIAGIGHLMLCISMVLILREIKQMTKA